MSEEVAMVDLESVEPVFGRKESTPKRFSPPLAALLRTSGFVDVVMFSQMVLWWCVMCISKRWRNTRSKTAEIPTELYSTLKTSKYSSWIAHLGQNLLSTISLLLHPGCDGIATSTSVCPPVCLFILPCHVYIWNTWSSGRPGSLLLSEPATTSTLLIARRPQS